MAPGAPSHIYSKNFDFAMGQGYTYTADQAVSKQQGQRIQLSISKRLWRRIKEVLQWSDCVRIGSRVVRICKLAIAI